MELLNEWLPLIVTVLLSAITIGLVLIHQGIMENTYVIRNAYSKLLEKEALVDPYKVQQVKVVNRVGVDVLNDVVEEYETGETETYTVTATVPATATVTATATATATRVKQ